MTVQVLWRKNWSERRVGTAIEQNIHPSLLHGTESDTSKMRDLFHFEDAFMQIVSNASVKAILPYWCRLVRNLHPEIFISEAFDKSVYPVLLRY